MPYLNIRGARLYYEEQGSGSETLVFAHGLLWSGEMFSAQIDELKSKYRCVTFDFRGQGKSETTNDGYDMDNLTQDAVCLIKELDCSPCHFIGLSMGGFVGMRLAIRHSEFIKSLILIETAADPEPVENITKYNRLNFITRWFGLRLVANKVMKIMFGQKFLTDPNRSKLRKLWKQKLISNNRIGITKAVRGVIDRDGVYEQIKEINTPTLILVGDQDVATRVDKAERMHQQILQSNLRIIPGAGHTSTVEEPEIVTQEINHFLSNLSESSC